MSNDPGDLDEPPGGADAVVQGQEETEISGEVLLSPEVADAVSAALSTTPALLKIQGLAQGLGRSDLSRSTGITGLVATEAAQALSRSAVEGLTSSAAAAVAQAFGERNARILDRATSSGVLSTFRAVNDNPAVAALGRAGSFAEIVANVNSVVDAAPWASKIAGLTASLPPPTWVKTAAERLGTMRPLIGGLDPAYLRDLAERFLPRNLRGIGIDGGRVLDVMRDEGIPFFLVPDGDTALLLLEAAEGTARRAVLVERAREILDACDEILDYCVDTEYLTFAPFTRKAIAAFPEHPEAAQALATNVMDTMLQGIKQRRDLTNAVSGHKYILNRPYRQAFALMPLPRAHAQYWAKNGDPIPSLFTRHATAHGVGPEQYSPANAVQAVMLATSVLGFLNGLW